MTMTFEHKFLLTITAAIGSLFFRESGNLLLKKTKAPVTLTIDLYEALRL
jgi:hypothetical protein